MKKPFLLYLLLVIIFINTYILFSKDSAKKDVNDRYFFYIPSQDEISEYFNFFNYLIKVDKVGSKIDKVKMKELYDNYINKDTFQSLLFEAFLRQTQNKKLQKIILSIIEENKLKDDFSKLLFRKYNSVKKSFKQDNKTQYQFIYKNEYYDENINLFYMSQVQTFNKKLGLMLFENNWINMSLDSPDKDPNRDSFFLIYGGGTNSMSIHFNEFINITFEDFLENEIQKEYNLNKYDNWKIKELPIEGIHKRAGADKIYIGYGTGPDLVKEINSGQFAIYLYNAKYSTGYVVSYFMNFSGINNNFSNRFRIWNHLLMHLNLTFIDLNYLK